MSPEAINPDDEAADWQAVADYLGQALVEVAHATDDENGYLTKTSEYVAAGELLVDASILAVIRSLYPGKAEEVVERAKQLQTEEHERQKKEVEDMINLMRIPGRSRRVW